MKEKPQKTPIIWTDERIHQAIRDMAAEGLPTNASVMQQKRASLYNAIKRKGISVQVAVEAAGLKYTTGNVAHGPQGLPEKNVLPAAIRYNPFERQYDEHRPNHGVVLNRIVSPLGMSEAQRAQMGGQ